MDIAIKRLEELESALEQKKEEIKSYKPPTPVIGININLVTVGNSNADYFGHTEYEEAEYNHDADDDDDDYRSDEETEVMDHLDDSLLNDSDEV